MHTITDTKIRCRQAIMDLCVPYYDARRGVPPTRKDMIADTAEVFMARVQTQLNAIGDQAERYRHTCVTELRELVDKVFLLVARATDAAFVCVDHEHDAMLREVS